MNPNHTLDSFAALVRDLRAAQRLYFSTRSATALADSKSLEKRVDDVLADLKHNPAQLGLFDPREFQP